MSDDAAYRIGPEGGVYFYGGPLSNFEPAPILLDGIWWPTVEHYFQAIKSTSLSDQEAIRHAATPADAKHMAKKLSIRPDWDAIKFEVMLTGLRAKFAQHDHLREVLLSTGDRPIYEDSPSDRVWGYRDGGLNLLGKALTKVREELRPSSS